MTTAPTYFLPGPNGEPPMFGPRDSGAFAWEMTPKNSEGLMLGLCTFCGDWCYLTEGAKRGLETPEAAADRCAIAAQGWIRSKGYGYEVSHEGYLWVQNYRDVTKPSNTFDPLNGSPDWHAAALWVNGQTKENR